MHSEGRFNRIITGAISGWLVLAGSVLSATYFDYTVPADPAPTDFLTLVSFSTPTGTGANRRTIVRIVTAAPAAGISFQIAPPATKKTAQVVVDGATDFVEVNGTAESVATLVRAEVISDAPDNVPVAAGFVMLRITIEYDGAYDFGAGETWNLKALEQTSARQYMGWVATDSGNVEALVSKAKPSITETGLNFGDVQQSISSTVAPVQALTVKNVGTAPLSITGAPISGDTAPSSFEVSVFISPAINPGGQIDNVFDEDASDGVTDKRGLWIMAHPNSLGDKTATVTVQSADGDVAVPLSAKGVTLYSELLMDVSGSMDWGPDGSFGVPENACRLTYAKEAAKEINNWIHEFSGGQSYLGLTSFPEPSGAGNSIAPAVVVPIDRSINTHPSIQIALGPEGVGGMKPKLLANSTPMEAGIVTAVGDMDARINGPQPPDAADRPNLRQALLLFTDGRQNLDSNAAGQVGSLNNEGIRVYTVGYGIPGSADVDQTLLQNIATGTGGQFFDANALDAFGLKDAFKTAVTPWLGLRTVVDPTGTIRQGQTRTHTICLDKTAYGVTFSVDWNRYAQGGISLGLTSPSGETITPASADVAYFESNTFAMYVIRGKRLRGGQGSGQWTLRLTGSKSIPAAEDTSYSYNALVQSPVGLEPRPSPGRLVTASRYLIEARLSEVYPKAITASGFSVKAQYNYPAQSFGSWLAQGKVEPVWIIGEQAAPQAKAAATAATVPRTGTIMGEYATLAQRKAQALAKLAKTPYENKRAEGTIQLFDDGTHGDKVSGDGIYSAIAPELRYDGVHNLIISAEASATSRGCIHREIRVSQYVGVGLSRDRIDRQLAWQAVSVSPYFDAELKNILSAQPPAGYERQIAVFTPQDSFGNYLGPGHASEIQFTLKGAKPLGRVMDNLDGSYRQAVEYQRGTNPTFQVVAGGVTSGEIPVRKSLCQRFFDWLKRLFGR